MEGITLWNRTLSQCHNFNRCLKRSGHERQHYWTASDGKPFQSMLLPLPVTIRGRGFTVSHTIKANIVENGWRNDQAYGRGFALNGAKHPSCPNRPSWVEEKKSQHGHEAAWFQHLLKLKMPQNFPQLLSVTGFLRQKEGKKMFAFEASTRGEAWWIANQFSNT